MTSSIEIFMIEGSKLDGMLENFPLKCTKFVLDLYFTEPSDQSLGYDRNYRLRYQTVYVLVKLTKLPSEMSLNQPL